MALTKTIVEDRIEVVGDFKALHIRTATVVKEDGVFLNLELDKYANEVLLPEMRKIHPNSSIKKKIIGEIINEYVCKYNG